MKTYLLFTLFLFGITHTIVEAQKQNLISDTTQASTWYEQGLSLQKKTSHDSATVLFEKASFVYKKYQLWEKQLACQIMFARSLYQMGKYEKAALKARQTMQESQAKLGVDNLKEADACLIIGLVYYIKDEYTKALEYYHKGLEIRKKSLGEIHPDVAAAYNNIGIVYRQKGEYDKALEYYQKDLLINLKVLGENNPAVAGSYGNIGNVYKTKGEYDKALEYHVKSLQGNVNSLGEKHPMVAHCYNNIGLVYYFKQDYDKALEYHLKSLEIRRNVLSETHPDLIYSYLNIGLVYYDKGEYDKALEYYKKGLQINIKVFGEMHPRVAVSYSFVGNVYNITKEYDKALEYYNKALQIRRKTLGETHFAIADSYNNIGSVYAASGEYNKALQHFQQGIISNMPSFHDTRLVHNPVLANQAGLYLDRNILLASLQFKAGTLEKLFTQSGAMADLQLAYQTYCSADTLAGQIQYNYSDENDKVAFTSKARQLYQAALSVCLQVYELSKEKSYLNKAFYFAERGKASVLSATLAESKAKNFAGIADSLLTQDQQLRTQIAAYTQKVAQELTKGEALDSSRLNNYQSLLFAAHRQQEGLIGKLEKEYPQYYNLKYQPATVTPVQVQSVMDEKTAIVEYAVADSLLYIFTLTQTNFTAQSLPIDSTFHRKLAAFRQAMLNREEDLYQQAAYALYKILLPQTFARSIRQLIIIPEGELTTLPFEALLTQNKKNKAGKAQPYLLNKYAISYAYSARLLYEQLIQPHAASSKHLLALAPVFADTLTNVTLAMNRSVLRYHQPVFLHTTPIATSQLSSDDAEVTEGEVSRGWLLDGQYVSPLLASKREVETIAHLFRRQGDTAQLYLYDQAKEEQLKSSNISTYNYLHLATHGFVNESYPELSGLLLAQDSTSGEDGILYMGEIYNLHLKADLVTLSACETGLGKLATGEGIIGLSRALLYAGARNIVVSFWKVPDESTASLMEDFYATLLSSGDKALALQTAKRKMLREGKYTHPFYWAPFVLVGR
jgi:CHAT domain-containing protein/lipopolysaccharide biosynthesis regulator YciM